MFQPLWELKKQKQRKETQKLGPNNIKFYISARNEPVWTRCQNAA